MRHSSFRLPRFVPSSWTCSSYFQKSVYFYFLFQLGSHEFIWWNLEMNLHWFLNYSRRWLKQDVNVFSMVLFWQHTWLQRPASASTRHRSPTQHTNVKRSRPSNPLHEQLEVQVHSIVHTSTLWFQISHIVICKGSRKLHYPIPGYYSACGESTMVGYQL